MPSVPSSREDVHWFSTTIALIQDDLNRLGACGQIVRLLDELSSSRKPLQVNLDLGRVDRITSAGLNELIGINSSARNRGIRVVLLDVQESVREIFALTRLERMFEFGFTSTES